MAGAGNEAVFSNKMCWFSAFYLLEQKFLVENEIGSLLLAWISLVGVLIQAE